MDYFTIPPLLTSADFYYDQIKSTTHRKGFISMLKDTIIYLIERLSSTAFLTRMVFLFGKHKLLMMKICIVITPMKIVDITRIS